jgi:rare lipoprotein A
MRVGAVVRRRVGWPLRMLLAVVGYGVSACTGAPRYTRLASVSDSAVAHKETHADVSAPLRVSRKKTSAGTFFQTGEASYYSNKFHGRKTASGERYNREALTAAHRTLPFGTMVRVTRKSNGKSVTVRINDRGPHKRGRIIDLSRVAALRIGLVTDGVAQVGIEIIGE